MLLDGSSFRVSGVVLRCGIGIGTWPKLKDCAMPPPKLRNEPMIARTLARLRKHRQVLHEVMAPLRGAPPLELPQEDVPDFLVSGSNIVYSLTPISFLVD